MGWGRDRHSVDVVLHEAGVAVVGHRHSILHRAEVVEVVFDQLFVGQAGKCHLVPGVEVLPGSILVLGS